MNKRFNVQKFPGGMHYIQLEENTISEFLKRKIKRIVCRINNCHDLHCALMKTKEGMHYIAFGAGVCKKLNLKAGSVISASFDEDSSQYQFEMPEEFQEILDTDSEANKIFHSLTSGNQRSLIYLITQVKSSDKRISRGLMIADKLKHGITSARIMLKSNATK